MACFCRIPLQAVQPSFAAMNLAFSPPKIPLAMNAALVLGGGSTRLDMMISAWMQNIRIPSIYMNGGMMAQLKIALGMFDLFDLPKLEAQLALGAQSLKKNAMPSLAFLAKLNLAAVLKLAAIARLQLALDQLKINLGTGMPPVPPNFTFNPKFALKPPEVNLGHMMLGVPVALNFAETLGMPVRRLPSYFMAMAKIRPPTLGFPISMILKICMALNAIATIKAAFGINALSPSGLSHIASKLQLYAALPIPAIPLPPLALQAKLEGLPNLDDLRLAAGAIPKAGISLALPPIPALPAMALMATLNATIGLNFPAAPCSAGNCAFG